MLFRSDDVKSSIDDAKTAADDFGAAAEDGAKKAQAAADTLTATYDAIGGKIEATFLASEQQTRAYYDALIKMADLNREQVQLIEAQRDAVLGLNKVRERGVEIDREEIAQVQQQIALAGGIGTQTRGPGTNATAAAAGGKGSGSGAGRDGVQMVQNVTINGLPTDRNSVRTWVSDVLLPELARLDRLSR